MPSRDDVLRELRLGPEWRLRRTAPVAPDDRVVVPAGAPPLPSASPPAQPATATAGGGSPSRLERIAALGWEDFAADVDACTACALCRTRNRSVPGVGDVRAQWLLIGEAPGAEEDARGEPFVGQAGKLLDNMLAALGMNRRENVYIANVLKCRPPGNRTPEPLEVEACRPYLERQIALIRPGLILALGKSAASLLLGTDASIASLRGRVHRCQGVPLVVTYHPAYLLRSLHDKARAWEDLLLARRALGASLSDAGSPAGR
jgi:DNA polymerase